MSAPYSATKVMLIRHAEKPTTGFQGVNLAGDQDSSSLIPQGWQRAGALIGLFGSSFGPLPIPKFLFAPNKFGSGTSQRPYETIEPLSEKLGLIINAAQGSTPASYAKTDYPQMLEIALACPGVVLISWEHGEIPRLAGVILGTKTPYPTKWPSERFDIVWIFDLDTSTNTYSFNQAPQLLLAGDLPTPIFFDA